MLSMACFVAVEIALCLSFKTPDSPEDSCLTLIPQTYDRHKPPLTNGKAAKVFVQIEVLDLDEINEDTMDFRLHAFVRSVWRDPRLSLNASNVHEACVKHIWIPDLMFEESKTIIDIGQHNTYFLERNGHFYLSQRYSFKVACAMNFQRYPFDTQHCIFSIAFMYTDDSEALLKWFDDYRSPFRATADPVVLTREVDPLQFIILTPKTNYTRKTYLFSNFTYLLADFALARRLTGSIINYYMPSAILVTISWITFWLREDAASERVTLTMTALLTIFTLANQYKSELPPVNYITAMDIWFFVCISMIFATLVEYAFSYNLHIKARRKNEKKMMQPEMCSDCTEMQDCKHLTDATIADNKNDLNEHRLLCSSKSVKLDGVCKISFPSFFLLFTSIYWANYCEWIGIW